MNPQDAKLELIRRHFDGTASEEDRDALQSLLRQDPAARRLFARYANIDSALGGGRIDLAPAETRPERVIPFSWRPLWAAAAGLVLGLFSASLVYGFVGQRRWTAQPLLKESFEDAAMPRDSGVPRRVDVWSGDLLAPEEAKGGVNPAEGRRMVTLPVVEKRKFSYAFRFLDVSALPPAEGSQSRQVEVTARFHGAVPGVRNRFQIRLAAFAEDAAGARTIWVTDRLNEQALTHVAKTVTTEPGDDGWKTLRSLVDVPAGAKVVLVSLAAGVADAEPSKTEHYLDDVHIQLITRDAQSP